MLFSDVIGQHEVKERLLHSYSLGRLAHTQLFLGPEGSGSLSLALAFAQYVNCAAPGSDDSCGECASCKKYQRLAHPDLHFYFPTTTNDQVKKEPRSELFLNEWRSFLLKNNGYATQNGWYEHLGVGNKQGTIYVRDAADIISKMALKAYEGRFKVMIIWLPEKLHDNASNKLLKTLEEPPANTLVIMVAERYELLLPTVRSRAQLIKVPKLTDAGVEAAMISNGSEPAMARRIAAQSNGNLPLAYQMSKDMDESQNNFLLFRQWLRLCFKPGDFVAWNQFNQNLVKLGRERQKSFLRYGLEVIHNSIILNGGQANLVKSDGEELDFAKNFSPYINESNRNQLYMILNDAIYHIERNAHSGILFTDLGLELVELMVAGRKQVKKAT